MRPRAILGLATLLIVALGACRPTVTVDTTTRFQEMRGWEALVNGMVECDRVSSEAARLKVLDVAANELGINRVRLALRGGYERADEQFAMLMAGKMTFDEWKRAWHVVENDNADPFEADTAGFHWGYLDYTVETLVLPLRDRLRARGDDLWIGVTHTGGARAQAHQENPEEYAEFVLQAFLHLRERYGIVPRSLELVNEPNKGRWTPAQVAANLVAAKRRLSQAGFSPRFVGPSTTAIDVAVEYAERMLATPGVREALTDVSYHRYSGGRYALERIGELKDSLGYGAAMTERIGADADTLVQDLTIAGVSSWEQFGLTNCAELGDAAGGVYIVFAEAGARADSTVRLTAIARVLRHYFLHVRLGAHRVGAKIRAAGSLKAVAFQNADGRVVVAMHDGEGEEVTLRGLATGRYRVWSSAPGFEETRADSVTTAGGALRVRVPAGGAVTVYQP